MSAAFDLDQTLADLRRRARWREETAKKYAELGDHHAAAWHFGEADGFRSAAYILEHYHQPGHKCRDH
jgi:hypothetical protein